MNDKPINVVVADDNDDMRELTAEVLTAFGFVVRSCPSVVAALAVIDDAVDVVLTDVRFGAGEANGLDLCKQVQATHPSVRVYVLSGDSSIESAAIGAGARAFWKKPVDMKDIVASISESDA